MDDMTHSELYTQTTRAVEDYLERHFLDVSHEAGRIHESYGSMWRHMGELSRGGKKLRPYLTMIGHGGFSQQVIPVAAAHELLHVAVLIHDDIIDEDTTRRGHLNINGLYQAKYRKFIPEDRSVHYSYAAGIVAGDALLSESYKLVTSAGFKPTVTARLIEQLHRSIFEVIGGELMDVEASLVRDTHYDPMLIYNYKTAGYSFIGPLVSGAICKGTPQKTMQLLEEIGLQLGIAFQLQDDLLGIFGDEPTLGKSVLLDLKEGKSTYPIAYHKEHMTDAQAKHFAAAFGNADASDKALHQLREDMVASGAKEKSEELIKQYFTHARTKIGLLNNTLQRDELHAVISVLTNRQS